jgi:putative ABC transport system permease protein
MSSTPPRALVVLYRWTTCLLPVSHRLKYGREQVRLFEQIWREERPSGLVARWWWAGVLLARSTAAAIGVRLDQRRLGISSPWSHAGGGSQMGSDLRFTLRSMRASSWYAMAVVGVIAVTMALATTTFAIVDGVLFKPLPYPEADRLVVIEPAFLNLPRPATTITGVSEVDVRNWQAAVPDVPMTAFRAGRWSGLGTGVNESAAGMAEVQASFFDVIGVAPLFGGFSAEDFRAPATVRPVVVTHDVWHSRFQGAADVIGREIISDRARGYGVRVVGVMPKGFVFPSAHADVAFLTPFVMPQPSDNPTSRNLNEVVARLPRGMTPAVLAERLIPGLLATAAQFPPQGPKPDAWSEANWRRRGPYDAVEVATLSESLARRAGPLFRAVFAAVLLLVAIAGANVSSLMTARALERQQEIAVRRSLGAGPRAIARLWIVEAGALLTIGGAIGVTLAPLLIEVITQLLPSSVVLLKPATLDWRVAGFVAGTLALMSVLVAAVPIRRSLTRRLLAGTTNQARGASERVRTPGRVAVISAQVGIAFVLTVVGVSLVGSLLTVYANNRPIRTSGVVALKMMFQGPGADMSVSAERTARERVIRERLGQVPGVTAVASTAAQVLGGGGAMSWFTPPTGTRHPPNIDTWPVTEGFYDALAPEVVQGRLPSNDELRSAAPLIVVSERAAQAYWPNTSPLGETLTDGQTKEPFTVVGVVREVRWLSWDTESPVVYAPYARVSRAPWLTVFLRTEANTGRVMAEALRAIEERDPMTRVTVAATLDDLYRDSVSLRRFQSWLFGGFAGAALVVVGVGILGLLAMSAARRTKEVGIRCALGATPGLVTALMVREQLGAVILGLLAGGVVAAWAVGFVEGYLYHLTTTDPRIWGAAVVLILAMAAVGTLIPAIHASRIDPLQALRTE